MRIAWIVSYYKPAYVYGGPVHSISALCEAVAGLGVDVTVLTTNANGRARLNVPLDRPVDVNGVTVWYFPLALNGLSFFYSSSLVRAIQQRISEFDLIVAEVMWGHALGPTANACGRARVPYVIPVRGQLLPWALAHKRWKKQLYLWLGGQRVLENAAAFHCTDQTEVDAVTRLGLRPPCFVVPNGIDTTRFDTLPERGTMRRRLGIVDDAIMLLFLGRLKDIKRPDIAISALSTAHTQLQDVHLVLVGPDEDGLMPKLEAQALALGCAAHVHFTGLLPGDDVLHILADADLLLMPTEVQENFGMAAAEALAAGMPILVSDGVPVGRWAQQAGAGLCVRSSADEFGEALTQLLLDRLQLQEMGQRGRELARERFDIRMVAREMLAQFETIATTGYPLTSN